MSLVKVLEQIKVNKPLAEENLDNAPVETIRNLRGRKQRAIQTLIDLRRQYKEELLKGAIFIVVTGSDKDTFEEIATSDKFELLSTSADSFYKNLAGRVPASLYQGKEGLSNIVDVLGRHLEDKAQELGVIGYPQIIFKENLRRLIKDSDDFTAFVTQVINTQVGSEMVGLQAVEDLTDKAIAKDHTGPLSSIILNASSEQLALEILPGLERLTRRVFLVGAGKVTKALKNVEDVISLKEVNEESVGAALLTIRKTIKK